MILDQFKDLIAELAAANGTGQDKIKQKIERGEVTQDEANLIFYYASISRLHKKLENMERKVQNVI